MKNLKFIFLIIYIASCTSCHGNNIDSVLLKQYSSKELITDLEFIKEKIISKRDNKTPYLFINQEKFNHHFDSIKQVISNQEQMSLKDFYILVTPFVNSICDDHLNFQLFGLWGIEKKRPKLFYENVMWTASAIIVDDKIYVSCSKNIPEKSQIISINDIADSLIITHLLKYTSYSGQRYYELHKVLPINFIEYSLITYSIFKLKDSITIKYKECDSDKIKEKVVGLDKFYDINSVNHCRNINKLDNYELKFDGNTTILRLNTFNFQNSEKTILFYNQIFDSIKANKTKNIILDISQNGGGSDINWLILLRYFTKATLQINCDSPKYDIKEVLNELKIDQTKVDSTKFYDGKLYLIIGAKTFSSAVRFADVLKSNGLCEKIFGQETLGQATHYGEMKKYNLPNTELQISVSSKLFPSLNCSEEKNGIIPDLTVKINSIDDYLNYNKNEFTIKKALEIIK